MNLSNKPTTPNAREIDELLSIRTLQNTGYGHMSTVRFMTSDWTRVIPVAKDRQFHKVIIHMSNEEVASVVSYKAWVIGNVKPVLKRLPANKKVFLSMGSGGFHDVEKMNRLLEAVTKAGLPNVRVVVPVDAEEVNGGNSIFLKELVKFIVRARSFLCLNIYPHRTLQETGVETSQPSRLCEVHDAALECIRALGVRGCRTVRTMVIETGWPYSGCQQASPEMAVQYAKHVATVRKNGTPLAPGPIEIVLQSLYDYDVYGGELKFGIINAIELL